MLVEGCPIYVQHSLHSTNFVGWIDGLCGGCPSISQEIGFCLCLSNEVINY